MRDSIEADIEALSSRQQGQQRGRRRRTGGRDASVIDAADLGALAGDFMEGAGSLDGATHSRPLSSMERLYDVLRSLQQQTEPGNAPQQRARSSSGSEGGLSDSDSGSSAPEEWCSPDAAPASRGSQPDSDDEFFDTLHEARLREELQQHGAEVPMAEADAPPGLGSPPRFLAMQELLRGLEGEQGAGPSSMLLRSMGVNPPLNTNPE